MDRNQTTGILLLTALMIVYFFWLSPEEPVTQENTAKAEVALQDSISAVNQKVESDSVLTSKYGAFSVAMKGEAQAFVLENEDVKVELNAQGGTVEKVTLKNYLTYTKEPLVLLDESSSNVVEEVTTAYGELDLNSFYYTATQEGNTVTFKVEQEGTTIVERRYSLADQGFVVDYDLDLNENYIKGNNVEVFWENKMKRLEKGLKDSRQKSTVNFYTVDQDFDYLSQSGNDEEEVEEPIRWVSSKQKFFNSAFITDTKFKNLKAKIDVNEDNDNVVKTTQIAFAIPVEGLDAANIRYYFGPNEYHLCEEVTEGFEKNVYLGWSFFAFISKWLIIPMFDFLEGFISSYGIIILIMVLVVKSLLFPLTYKSYLSMAKMRALKPELDEMKEKIGDDMTKVQQEQMKLYQKAGVNPISGCIPMLAQMPVFLALFNFFPNAIQLRQESFLWADDLSSYDSILNLPFDIPAYGSHVSLFTLLWAASTLVYTYFNNQMQSGSMQNNQMKYVSYITPVFFLVFFNSFASGLTYYYFISNLVTIAQQVFSRNFINEDKLRKIIEENKKKNANKKKSGFQQRLEDAMKAQEQATKDRKGGKKK
ncbi:membrane protein insertase YidC [Algivirga pacifica]|uniref:Membrane protein insertase YidC n=1 Tax=Algivirga pacifica TaxID=1162670 RepID=A0ABP9DKB7_9BACT